MRPPEAYFCRAATHPDLANDEDAHKHPSNATTTERYSWRVYAGMYCDSCWTQDGRNHDNDATEFDPAAAGENMDPD